MSDDHTTPPPPPAYEAPAYGATAAPPANQSNGMAVASLVLGILALITSLIPIIGVVAWLLAPLGLIFGFIALGKPVGKGLAIGGLITSGLGLLICIAWVTVLGAVLGQAQRDGVFEEIEAASNAEISSQGDTTTITTDEGTTTVTTVPNAPGSETGGGEPSTAPQDGQPAPSK